MGEVNLTEAMPQTESYGLYLTEQRDGPKSLLRTAWLLT